jgi:hypothetical protein
MSHHNQWLRTMVGKYGTCHISGQPKTQFRGTVATLFIIVWDIIHTCIIPCLTLSPPPLTTIVRSFLFSVLGQGAQLAWEVSATTMITTTRMSITLG